MKSIGVVRKTDPLGRISLPSEIRKTYNLGVGSEIEISTSGDTIILRKHETTCVFCGTMDSLKEFQRKAVCEKCVGDLK